jgi:hypothetical protein
VEGKIDTITVKNVTYIPLNVIPKKFTPAFKNVKKVEKPNNPTHVIKINGENYVPITNRTVKPVTFDGAKYVPVYTAPAGKVD